MRGQTRWPSDEGIAHTPTIPLIRALRAHLLPQGEKGPEGRLADMNVRRGVAQAVLRSRDQASPARSAAREKACLSPILLSPILSSISVRS